MYTNKNFEGGATAVSTTSWVGYRGFAGYFTMPVGTVDYWGDNPVLIHSARTYVGGRNAARTVRYEIGTPFQAPVIATGTFSVAEATSASRTGYKTFIGGTTGANIFNVSATGQWAGFFVRNSATDAYLYYGKGGTVGEIDSFSVIAGKNELQTILTTTNGLPGNLEWCTSPSVVPTFTASAVANTLNASLAWTAPTSDGGDPLTGYSILYSPDNWVTVYIKDVLPTVTSTTLALPGPGTYKMHVTARNTLSDQLSTANAGTPMGGPKSVQRTVTVSISSTNLDGWTTFGTATGYTRSILRKSPSYSIPIQTGPGTDIGNTDARIVSKDGMALHISGGCTSATVSTNITAVGGSATHINFTCVQNFAVGTTVYISGTTANFLETWDGVYTVVSGTSGTTLRVAGNYTALVAVLGPLSNSTGKATPNALLGNGSVGIQKTVTGLTIGTKYIVGVGLPWQSAASPATNWDIGIDGIGYSTEMILNQYPLGVKDFTPDEERVLIENVGGSPESVLVGVDFVEGAYYDLPYLNYEFTATATSHVIKIRNKTLVPLISTGTKEAAVFSNIFIGEKEEPSPYSLQDTKFSGSAAQHFDLATRSVGASWWVDRNDVTKFKLSFTSNTPLCTFTDTKDAGKYEYLEIVRLFDTKSVTNDLRVKNIGVVRDYVKPTDLEERVDEYSKGDIPSINNWGSRKLEVTTNIANIRRSKNLVWNGGFEKSLETHYRTSTVANYNVTRVKISSVATGATNYLTAGAAGPNGACTHAMRIKGKVNATTLNFATGPKGDEGSASNQEEHNGWAVEAVNAQTGMPLNYTASAYFRGGIGSTSSTRTGRIWIRWFDAQNEYIGNSTIVSSAAVPAGSWTKATVTAQPPTGAKFAQVGYGMAYSSNDSAGKYHYVTGISLTYDDADMYSIANYFNGNSADTDTWLYDWDGEPYASASSVYDNNLPAWSTDILSNFSEPVERTNSIVWNAQEDIYLAYKLDIGEVIAIEFQGSSALYRIVGLEHDISPERWLININVEEV